MIYATYPVFCYKIASAAVSHQALLAESRHTGSILIHTTFYFIYNSYWVCGSKF